ncbi:hypothetical protein R3P38DRAFT_3191805 [Favolaschia claudopus]|uniref:Uncharacterized protein n=1 Tax=Favolaschia claudopus TaxID=2862362 RepID=A0AAW0BLC3_9AGAR
MQLDNTLNSPSPPTSLPLPSILSYLLLPLLVPFPTSTNISSTPAGFPSRRFDFGGDIDLDDPDATRVAVFDLRHILNFNIGTHCLFRFYPLPALPERTFSNVKPFKFVRLRFNPGGVVHELEWVRFMFLKLTVHQFPITALIHSERINSIHAEPLLIVGVGLRESCVEPWVRLNWCATSIDFCIRFGGGLGSSRLVQSYPLRYKPIYAWIGLQTRAVDWDAGMNEYWASRSRLYDARLNGALSMISIPTETRASPFHLKPSIDCTTPVSKSKGLGLDLLMVDKRLIQLLTSGIGMDLTFESTNTGTRRASPFHLLKSLRPTPSVEFWLQYGSNSGTNSRWDRIEVCRRLRWRGFVANGRTYRVVKGLPSSPKARGQGELCPFSAYPPSTSFSSHPPSPSSSSPPSPRPHRRPVCTTTSTSMHDEDDGKDGAENPGSASDYATRVTKSTQLETEMKVREGFWKMALGTQRVRNRLGCAAESAQGGREVLAYGLRRKTVRGGVGQTALWTNRVGDTRGLKDFGDWALEGVLGFLEIGKSARKN